MFPFKLEVLSCSTVLFFSLGSRNKHRQTCGAFLCEALMDIPPGGCCVRGTGCAALALPVNGCPPCWQPPTSSPLNGTGRLNGALCNGSQFSWSMRRRGAKAVCESPCSLRQGEFTPFPLLLSPGELGLLSSPSTHPAPSGALHGRTWMTQQPLHLWWHGLFSAHAMEMWEARG